MLHLAQCDRPAGRNEIVRGGKSAKVYVRHGRLIVAIWRRGIAGIVQISPIAARARRVRDR